jgi:replicative superfamily II helicase
MKIGWTSNVRNEEMLQRAKEEMNILRTIKLRNANWIGCILHRNCPLTHVVEGKITGRI